MSREGRSRWDFGWRRSSHFVIGKPGDPMMHRWRLLQTPLFGIYLHFIYREDLDPVPHDHPWQFWSLVLRGGYEEELHERPGDGNYRWATRRVLRAHRFPLHHAHRIVSVKPRTVTLCVVGRKRRTWGFYDGARFVDYRQALGLRPTEGIAEARMKAEATAQAADRLGRMAEADEAERDRLAAQVAAVRALCGEVENRMMATAKPSEIRAALDGTEQDEAKAPIRATCSGGGPSTEPGMALIEFRVPQGTERRLGAEWLLTPVSRPTEGDEQ